MEKRLVITFVLFIFMILNQHAFSKYYPRRPYYKDNRYGFGLSVGYGTVYGFGPQFIYIRKNIFEANAGVGLNIAGTTIGAGMRCYFYKKKRITPFMGIYCTMFSGQKITVTSSDPQGSNTVIYKLPDENIIHLNSGIKFVTGKSLHLIGIGYGIPLKGISPQVVSGSPSSTTNGFVKVFGPGGFEISYTLIFAF